MKRAARFLGTVFLAAGLLGLAWTITVWRWQDPVTALYTHYEQARLDRSLERQISVYRAAHRRVESTVVREQRFVAAAAGAERRQARLGQAIGRIVVPRMGLDMVVVNGTDEETLKKGPGRYLGSALPGQGRLVYIAGHRTTYLAPFSKIDQLHKGDRVTIVMPYATFVYRVSGFRIVAANDLSVLRSPSHELLELQACHPRFFATHRFIAFALPVEVIPRGGRPYSV
ncbi:MAG TPA: class E sortase [Gaiellaceae bacterium]